MKTLEDIRNQYGKPKNVRTAHKKELSSLERLAVFVTEKIGTMGFFFIIFVWTVVWLFWNIYAPSKLRFDPYPAFVLWLFISNLIQIHLMPLIMVGQNIQGKYADMRAENDYKVNVKAEKEVELILERLKKNEELLQEILKQMKRNK